MLLSESAIDHALWLLGAEINALLKEGEVTLVGIPMVKSPLLLHHLLTFDIRFAATKIGLDKAALGFEAWQVINLAVGMGDI